MEEKFLKYHLTITENREIIFVTIIRIYRLNYHHRECLKAYTV